MNRSVDDAETTANTTLDVGTTVISNKFDQTTPDEAVSIEVDNIKIYNSVDEFDRNLPSTVSLLTNEYGSKVYIVGTAHFSRESQDDVSLVIRNVRPDIVMVELCAARVHMLSHDEKTLLEEAKDINLAKVCMCIIHFAVDHRIINYFNIPDSQHYKIERPSQRTVLYSYAEYEREDHTGPGYGTGWRIPSCIGGTATPSTSDAAPGRPRYQHHPPTCLQWAVILANSEDCLQTDVLQQDHHKRRGGEVQAEGSVGRADGANGWRVSGVP